jgi:hypothetical protein
MKRMIGLFAAMMLVSVSLFAQQPDSTAYSSPDEQQQRQKPKSSSSLAERLYFGGSVGFSFGDYSRISVTPMIGCRLTKMWSVGVRAGYEHIKDERYAETLTSDNYGGSAFLRFRPIPQLYLHGEYAYYSYKFQTANFESDREWVPFLFAGGGYVQQISPRVSAFVEVLVDVLRDDRSPYEDWDPMISVGVWAGL